MDYESFENLIKEAVEEFKKINIPIRVISNYDSDGIAAASILIKALHRENKKFVVSIIKQLKKDFLEELSRENYKVIIFTDLGSSCINLINNILNEKKVLILDHHKPDAIENKSNIIHINPLLFGINANEISGAGVTYLFCKSLNEDNKESAYLAIIGAIGDMQEEKGFIGLNKEILEDAKYKLEIKIGLRMFGMQTKPLHKVLEYSTDPYIPGVSGSEENSILFLEDIGIKIKENDKWRKLIDLNNDEMKKLVTGIILKRLGSEKNPEDVLGPIYILKEELEELPTKDLREFSTLLNATGRLGKSSLGIGVCLNNKGMKDKAFQVLKEYKLEIINALNWFYKNRKTNNIIEDKSFVFINAENNIKDSLIGTLASIISKSNFYDDNTIILAMAYTLDDNIKASLRITGKSNIDLRNILEEISKEVKIEFGGHKNAAGCIFSLDKEEDFIKSAIEFLKNRINVKIAE